jgi:hypothetical protein
VTVAQLAARHGRLVRVSAAVTELAFMLVLFLGYKAVRLVANDSVDLAMGHALAVRHLEHVLGLPSELRVQHWMLGIPHLPVLVNSYYAYVHFPATIAFLVWFYVFKPTLYPRVRSVIIVMTAASLIVHLSYPLAPARMLTSFGFVDVGRLYGPDVYGAPAHSLANQYAAMPSLHVGWSILVAVGLIVALRTRWRWVFLAHPIITTFVVVSTGHHYWLDGIVAAVLLVLAFVVVVPGRAKPLPEEPDHSLGAAERT